MGAFILICIGVPVFLLLVTGQYIFGRIVLPEVGLIAPSWDVLFWGELFLMTFAAPIYAIKAAL